MLEVRDPGTRLLEGQAPPTPPKTWPLTWAVAETVADANGIYEFASLPVGQLRVSANAAGFSTSVVNGVVTSAGMVTRK